MKELQQLQNQLKAEKELTITLEAQLLTAQEELSKLTIKTKQSPTWEQLNEVETQRDKIKKEYSELKEKLEQVSHEKQELEVQFKDLSANRLTSEEIKLENQKLTKNLTQSQNKVKELEAKVKELESEMLTEQIANDNILNKERRQRQVVEQELVKKRAEWERKITNHEKRKEVSDEVIQRLREEIRTKNQKIKELEQQLEMKVEVLPK